MIEVQKIRAETKIECEQCGKTVSLSVLGSHERSVHGLSKAQNTLLKAVTLNPGMTCFFYNKKIGRSDSARLAKTTGLKKWIRREPNGGHGFRLFLTSDNATRKSIPKEPKVAPKASILKATPTDEFDNLPVIVSVTGKTYTVKEGTLYRVTLERV